MFSYIAVLTCSIVGFTTKAAEVPSPAALYPLNAQFETKDISGNHNPPGRAVGVKLVEGPDGKPGGSYYFNGSATSYIEFPGSDMLDTRYSITLLAMVYPESEDGSFFSYNINTLSVRLWVTFGKLFWIIANRSSLITSKFMRSALIITNKWSYVGATYDFASGWARIWINGTKAGALHVGTMEIATNYSARMGAVAYSSWYLKGRVSCLQVYNKSLTQIEIDALQSRCLEIKPFSMCFDHVLLDDRTRRETFEITINPKTDYGVLSESVWYRFRGRTHLASTCVPEGRCGTQATGWLNDSYPSLETGIAKVEVCFNSGGNCCAYKDTVYVRQCSGFYVYKFEGVKSSVTPKRRFCVEDKEEMTSSGTTSYVSVAGSDLVGNIIYTESQISSVVTCTGYCTLLTQCMAVNYNPLTGTCELSNSTRETSPAAPRPGFYYYEADIFTVYYF